MKKIFRKNKGYTLVEFMVAITIGLILLAGLTYLFVGMKGSNRAQSSISTMQENGRFALYFLTNELQKAGWADVEGKGFGFYTSPSFQFTGATAVTDGGAANVSDRVTVRYENATDCLGQNAPGGIAENSFFFNAGQLMCLGNGGTGSQPIISGVDSIHYLYGIDSDNNASPNKFVRADQIATSEQEAIVAIKIILLLVSDDDVHKANKSQSFTIFQEPAVYSPTADKKLRKIISTTVASPNKPTFAISS